MGSEKEVNRIVFDTNTVLSALLFSKGRLAWLRDAWRNGGIIPVVSQATSDELVGVLHYPKFGLDQTEREDLLNEFFPYAEVVEKDDPSPALPQCRDADDQKFLELALAAQADALVSGDNDLHACKADCPFPILTPAELKEKLQTRHTN
jgi:putative PIN family toxin of toxin-antitoxin system